MTTAGTPAAVRVGARSAPSPLRLLNRDFLLLCQGQLVSQVGDQAALVAMMYWTMQETGSASLVGLMGMAASLPQVLLGPLGGAVADRHSRRGIIVAADVVRGVAVLAVAVLFFVRPEATVLLLSALFVLAALGGAADAVFTPAVTAAIPDLVPGSRLAAANSLHQLSVHGATLVGQALGGVLYRLLGAPLLILVDGLSYLASAASERWVRIPETHPDRPAGDHPVLSTYLDEARAGLRFVRERPGMRSFVLTATGLNLLFAPVFVLLPFHVAEGLQATPDWYGFLLAALSAGALLGMLGGSALKLRRRARGRVVIGTLVGAGLLLASLGLVRQPVGALVVCLGLGAAVGTVNLFAITLLQVGTPAAMRGRVMGLVMALAQAAVPLGMAAAGFVGDLTGMDTAATFGVCGAAAALLAIAAATRPAFRDFLAHAEARERASRS